MAVGVVPNLGPLAGIVPVLGLLPLLTGPALFRRTRGSSP